jgi:hypothetical protein
MALGGIDGGFTGSLATTGGHGPGPSSAVACAASTAAGSTKTSGINSDHDSDNGAGASGAESTLSPPEAPAGGRNNSVLGMGSHW